LTLTAATHVIHLSRWWNPAVEDQCTDRAYRIGQTRPVTVHLLLAVLPGREADSFDRKLDELLARKRQLSREILHPPAGSEKDRDGLYRDVFG
jgi:SNF2 family DNA or RNA helicase